MALWAGEIGEQAVKAYAGRRNCRIDRIGHVLVARAIPRRATVEDALRPARIGNLHEPALVAENAAGAEIAEEPLAMFRFLAAKGRHEALAVDRMPLGNAAAAELRH